MDADRIAATIKNKEGIALGERGLFGQAAEKFEEAIRLAPGFFDAYNNLAKTYNEMGDFERSIELCQKMLTMTPYHASILQNIAKSYGEMGRHNEAISYYYESLRENPAFQTGYSDLFLTLNYMNIPRQTMFMEHAKFGRFDNPQPNHASPKDFTKEKITLGYVSPDFRVHPVAYLLLPVLKQHDREKFKIILYSNTQIPDQFTDMFKKSCDVWRDITKLDDTAAFDLVRSDAVDILIDVTGHTGNNRLTLFSLKPAPIQVSWLGYMNTTGLKTIDYRITDTFLSVPGSEKYYTEKLVKLPDSFVFDPIISPPKPVPLPALTNGFVTFGSMNNYKKINDRVINLWVKILKAVPYSKLIISVKGDEKFNEKVIERFIVRGIEKERIELIGLKLLPDFIKLFDTIDIMLDPFPFTGCITIFHGLYAGVPSVVVCGESEYERNASAVMRKAKLPEFIAKNAEEYVEKAVYWATHLKKLADIRKNLPERFDKDNAQRVTKDVENFFEEIVQKNNKEK